MGGLPELTLVLSKIASEVRRLNALAPNFDRNEDDGASRAIVSLVKSLNAGDQSSSDCRVLDAALSLMCLNTTEVCRARIECLVGTMTSVLQSSVSCKVCRLGREGPEYLQVGSSISFGDCNELMRVGADVLESIEMNSGSARALLHTLLTTTISSSIYQVPFSWPSPCDRGTEMMGISRKDALSRLMLIASDGFFPSGYETPQRLYFWCLDPLVMKNDISEVLRETMQRPFLFLSAELYKRLSWRRIILCFATSPTMFRQATTLLHTWFLVTGVTFVLELQVALVSSLLDMISRPMAWGVPMELGLKYPFAHAYFPSNSQKLMGLLTGFISCNTFIDLVQCIKSRVTYAESSKGPILGLIDNNSTWSLLMKFPTWFYFAVLLIFYRRNIQGSRISVVIATENNFDSTNDEHLNGAAIFFLSLILSPVDKGHGDKLAEHLLKTSRSWSLASRTISNCNVKMKLDYDDKVDLSTATCSFATLESWLHKFDGVNVESWCRPFLRVFGDSKSKNSKRLFNKIPLGIIILYPQILSDMGCELLLYYATTGELLQSFQNGMSLCYASDGTKWALDGACLVFAVFDMIDEISKMIFDCETTRLDFICDLKGKVCKYLLKCVNMLLLLCVQELVEIGGRIGLLDLYKRLIQWKQLGREMFEGHEKFNGVVDNFAREFKISGENIFLDGF